MFISCTYNDAVQPIPTRKIKFELFTEQDFSAEINTITFEASISAGKNILWDSTFAPMAIKDIPKIDRLISFEKIVKDGSNLKVGFKYSIEGVGTSWYYEQMLSAEASKTLSFSFK
jgi:hypothetical protein